MGDKLLRNVGNYQAIRCHIAEESLKNFTYEFCTSLEVE
jgi:hypothetical protein